MFGKPIVQWIVEKFSPEDEFIFVCRQEHLEDPNLGLEDYLLTLAPTVKVLGVENHKLGPVHSLLRIKEHFQHRQDIIVNYCDFDWRWNYTDFKSWLEMEKPSSAVCVYRVFSRITSTQRLMRIASVIKMN